MNTGVQWHASALEVVPIDRILATYRIETPHPLETVANLMAREASTGTFLSLPGESAELTARHGAVVCSITELGLSATPSLPGTKAPEVPEVYRQAEVTLSFPLENMGPSLPNLLATVAGGSYDLGQLSGVRLARLELPQAFAEAYPGPQFGVEGTRALAGVRDRPLIGSIMKPSVGMTPEQTAATLCLLMEAGVDFVKDDECMANPPHFPLAERVRAVMGAIDDFADRTGKRVMYAFNITDDLEMMLRHHDAVVAAGGTCVMVSINPVGLTGAVYLRNRCQLPIHAHRNGWGAMSRHPLLGMDFQPYQTIWRLAGVDQLHCSGIRNKFWDSDESVAQAARDCLTPLLGTPPVMPVLSSGQWAGQAVDTYRAIGSVDLMHVCGGGIIGHPGGPAAGVASVRQGWEAAMAGRTLEEHARENSELRQAMERFGER